jgi:hypothetical protein
MYHQFDWWYMSGVVEFKYSLEKPVIRRLEKLLAA